MSATVHFRLSSICMNALHTICVIGISVLPFIFESVYKHDFKMFDVWPLNWKSLYLLLSIVSLLLYYSASFKDPGYVPLPKNCMSENSEDEDEDVTTNEDSNMLERGLKLRHCGFCGMKQPLRARHCETCGRCVRRFDHHCPWLGNCVGEGNHRYFILFVVASTIGLIWSAYLVWNSNDSRATSISPYTNNLRWVSIIALLFLSLPLAALSVIHTYLTFSNVTAWEFMSRHRISYLKNLDDVETNPFHLGCWRNGFVVLCSRSYQSWEKVYQRFLGRGLSRLSGFEC